MDVSALAGALAARVGALTGDADLIREGGRLVRYVVSKQTDYGAWYYADPPSASHITHDNYHTGFILDAILQYGLSAGSDEFEAAYRRGIEFYERRLFEPNGAARFMSDRLYPIDIHGCAQGIITFSLQQRHFGTGGADGDPGAGLDPRPHVGPGQRLVLLPAAPAVPDAASGSCAGARAGCRWALASYLENCGGTVMRGFPGRELSLDPERSRFERLYAEPARRPRQRAAHPAATGAARHRGLVPDDPGRRLRLRRVQLRAGQATPGGPGPRRRQRPRPGRPGQRDRRRAPAWPTAISRRATSPGWASTKRSTWSSASTTSSTSMTTSRPCARSCTPCARAGGWWSTFPVTSGGGSSSAAGSTSTCRGTSGPATGPRNWWPSCRTPASRSPPTLHLRGARDVHQQHLVPDHRGRPAQQAAVRRGVPGAAGRLLPREVLPAAVGRRRPGRRPAALRRRPTRPARPRPGARGLSDGSLIACGSSSTSSIRPTSTSSATSTAR